jgi:hypothetical protein
VELQAEEGDVVDRVGALARRILHTLTA